LSIGCLLHKYIDDTILGLYELVKPNQLNTHISTYLADKIGLLTWNAAFVHAVLSKSELAPCIWLLVLVEEISLVYYGCCLLSPQYPSSTQICAYYLKA